jgi:hypothetical protein
MSASMRLPHMDLGLRPDKIGQAPPLPPGFGTLAGYAPPNVAPNPVTPVDPQALANQLTQLAPQGNVSDLVKVQYGPVDKQLIGQLLASVAGQDSGLVGVPSTFASQRLTQLGLPQHFEDWTTDQWDQRIGELEAQNPPSILF